MKESAKAKLAGDGLSKGGTEEKVDVAHAEETKSDNPVPPEKRGMKDGKSKNLFEPGETNAISRLDQIKAFLNKITEENYDQLPLDKMMEGVVSFHDLANTLLKAGCYPEACIAFEKAISFYERTDEAERSTAPGKDIYIAYTVTLIRLGRIDEAEQARKKISLDDPEQAIFDYHILTKQLDAAVKDGHKEKANEHYDKLAKLGCDMLSQKSYSLACSIFLTLTPRLFLDDYHKLLSSKVPIGKILLEQGAEPLIDRYFAELIDLGNKLLKDGDIKGAQAIAKALFVSPHGQFHDFVRSLRLALLERENFVAVQELYVDLLSISSADLPEECINKLNALKIEFVKMFPFSKPVADKETKCAERVEAKMKRSGMEPNVVNALVTRRERHRQTAPQAALATSSTIVSAHRLSNS